MLLAHETFSLAPLFFVDPHLSVIAAHSEFFASCARSPFSLKSYSILNFVIFQTNSTNGTNFHPYFYPTFFSFASNLTYMKQILHLVSVKNITFRSSYIWFKIDMHQQLRPLTANYLAMFKVISSTIYII